MGGGVLVFLEIGVVRNLHYVLVKTVSGQLPPQGKLPLVRVGVSVKVRVSFRVKGQPHNYPRGKLSPG